MWVCLVLLPVLWFFVSQTLQLCVSEHMQLECVSGKTDPSVLCYVSPCVDGFLCSDVSLILHEHAPLLLWFSAVSFSHFLFQTSCIITFVGEFAVDSM